MYFSGNFFDAGQGGMIALQSVEKSVFDNIHNQRLYIWYADKHHQKPKMNNYHLSLDQTAHIAILYVQYMNK